MSGGTDQTTTPSRYVVGIDLGTTNSAVTYVDTGKSPWKVRTFAVAQVVAPGEVERRETLPSFHYQPSEGELAEGMLRCPWHTGEPGYSVGFFARDQGTAAPGRSIASAKSWLCHSGVDRTADLLPWQAAPEVEKLSPVEAAARYLGHVADAWNHDHPRHPLAEQDIVLTLPASFDEVARALTVKAAAQAGLPRVVLIEEPQAAFYAWLDKHADDWEQLVEPGQKILVCDVGGGTSDFTLIRVRRDQDGKVQFHRVAVGDHLILGGDNLDLALAHRLEQRLSDGDSTAETDASAPRPAPAATGGKLDPRQWAVLVRSCRQVKETLLGANAPERLTVHLPSTGSRLIGGGRQVEVSRDEVEQWLVEGFFPQVALDDKPQTRQSGFQEFGLPYAPDPAITRSLAAFLTAHRHVTVGDEQLPTDRDPARPDVVLFNGGVFASPVLRQRLVDALRAWFGGDSAAAAPGSSSARPAPDAAQSGWEPLVLDNERLDLAVARGAAYYGMVRRGEGVRIAAGLARTYYIGVDGGGDSPSLQPCGQGEEPPAQPAVSATRSMAVCLVPAGVEPGHGVDLSQRRFHLTVAEPVEFPLYYSSTRLTDKPGGLVAVDREQMTPLPPIRTVIQTRRRREAGTAEVELHARLTEIGTLDLWCSEVGGRRRWRLQFDVRTATQTDVAAHQSAAEAEGLLDEATWEACRELIQQTFSPEGKQKPARLVKQLAAAIGSSRNQWPASLCRRIWEALIEVEPGRRRSQAHESRWINLLGFSLRPGYGIAVDDWRVAQTWARLQGKIAHPGRQTRSEGWILWRRIGGGLSAGQQLAVAEPLLAPIRGLYRQSTTGKRRGGDVTFSIQQTAEVWRLLGSLELLDVRLKLELGEMLLALLPKRKMEPVRPAMAWALGRIGARQPAYGPLNAVVPAETAQQWLTQLVDAHAEDPNTHLAVMQLARRTGDRYRDVSDKARRRAEDYLLGQNAQPHFVELVRHVGQLDRDEQGMVFGESLPKGLQIA